MSGPTAGGPPGSAAEVSVVVPYYRDQAGLERLLAALAAQDHPASRLQVVVADDGSPEPPRLPGGLPFETAVVRQEDRGFRASAARALGVEAAEGRVLAFLDGDMLPEPGYLAAACAAPAASAQAVVVGRRRHLDPRLLEDGAWRPGDDVPAWARLGDPAWLAEAYARSRNLALADATSYRFVISAVLTVAREVYADAGGFDPAFVGYGGEDWELAHRLWRCGGELRHEPAAVAWQAGADFGGREDPAEARRKKNREAMVLAPRISAPTARGLSLGLTGAVAGLPGQGAPRVAVTLSTGSARDAAAAVVLGVDAAVQAFPAARVRVVGELGAAAAACLADPRVSMEPAGMPVAGVPGEPVPGAPAPTPAVGELHDAPDWAVDVVMPVRPAGRGERPDPRAVAAWLLEREREGVERVELTDDAERVAVLLVSVRGRWRALRDPEAAVPTRRLALADLGWRTVEADPDLEGWWGGWS